MEIRRFTDADATQVSEMIARSLRVSCVKDYGEGPIESLIQRMQPKDMRYRAAHTHFFVAEENGRIVGCGAIGPYRDSKTESCLFNVFVDPAFQRRGVGMAIVEALEADALAKGSERIEVHASITGKPFYHALGYTASLKHQQPDGEGLYLLEKIRTPE